MTSVPISQSLPSKKPANIYDSSSLSVSVTKIQYGDNQTGYTNTVTPYNRRKEGHQTIQTYWVLSSADDTETMRAKTIQSESHVSRRCAESQTTIDRRAKASPVIIFFSGVESKITFCLIMLYNTSVFNWIVFVYIRLIDENFEINLIHSVCPRKLF